MADVYKSEAPLGYTFCAARVAGIADDRVAPSANHRTAWPLAHEAIGAGPKAALAGCPLLSDR